MTRSFATASVVVAAHVDYDRARQDEHGILRVCDIDAVGVGPGEPLLRDLRDRLAAAGDDVFVIAEVAFGVEVALAVDADFEGAAEEGEHLLADGGDVLVAAIELVG